jgi:hypothetical protein
MITLYDNRLQYLQNRKAISQLARETVLTVPGDDIEVSDSNLDHMQGTAKGRTIESQCAGMLRRLLG